MVIEVHVGTKPARPRRALLGTIGLLVLTGALAAAMTWTRSQDDLGMWIEPKGWSIAFRPPRRFLGEVGLTSLGPAYRFHGRFGPQAIATLVVHRVEVDGANNAAADDALGNDAAAVCERIRRTHLGDMPPAGLVPQTRLDTRVGSRDAVEVWDPMLDLVVRAVVVGPGDAYAITLGVADGSIIPDIYRLFDETCRSVEYHARGNRLAPARCTKTRAVSFFGMAGSCRTIAGATHAMMARPPAPFAADRH